MSRRSIRRELQGSLPRALGLGVDGRGVCVDGRGVGVDVRGVGVDGRAPQTTQTPSIARRNRAKFGHTGGQRPVAE
eukprot:3355817-Pyramimonas_sp.AAC.1